MSKYPLPGFLKGVVSQSRYEAWVRSKAKTHVRRDRRRFDIEISVKDYRDVIHEAVVASRGRDAYTGELLEWELIGTYDNVESRRRGAALRRELALMPTVDHVVSVSGPPDFRICSWRTNDAKSDLNPVEFLDLCQRVVSANTGNRADG